jgi:glucose/arabinose dehydrogenase
LQTGDGTYRGTEAGRAASDLTRAPAALTRAKWKAEHGPRWRERRAAAKKSANVAGQLADAEQRWRAYVVPEAARLEAIIGAARQVIDGLVRSQERESARRGQLARRGHSAGRAAARFADGLAVYREALDDGKSHTLSRGQRPLRPAPWVAPVHHQPTVERDIGPDI